MEDNLKEDAWVGYESQFPSDLCPMVVEVKKKLQHFLFIGMQRNDSSYVNQSQGNLEGRSTKFSIHPKVIDSYRMDFDAYDWKIFSEPHYYQFYGAMLPAFATFGIFLNILCLLVFHHKDMRSLCTLFLKAVLVSDTIYVICLVLIRTPLSRLSHDYKSPDQPGFWHSLYICQAIFTWLYPLTEMAECFVVFYLVAAVWDQYCVFYHPELLSRWSRKDKGMKILFTILLVNILIHMVHFFKFVQKNILNPGGRHKHWRICLSDIYRSEKYQAYDKYVYFILFQMLPTVVVFLLLIPMVKAYHFHRKEIKRLQLPDINLLRTFKSGRSVPMMLTVGLSFLVLKTISNVTYIWTMKYIRFEVFSPECELTPTDRRFDCVHPEIELIYVAVNVTHSSIKFFLFLCSSAEFRGIFGRNFVIQMRKLGNGVQKLFIECLTSCKKRDQVEDEVETSVHFVRISELITINRIR